SRLLATARPARARRRDGQRLHRHDGPAGPRQHARPRPGGHREAVGAASEGTQLHPRRHRGPDRPAEVRRGDRGRAPPDGRDGARRRRRRVRGVRHPVRVRPRLLRGRRRGPVRPAVVLALAGTVGCAVHVASLKVVTTKRIPANRIRSARSRGWRDGHSCRFWLVGLPFGLPQVDEAIDEALAPVGGAASTGENDSRPSEALAATFTTPPFAAAYALSGPIAATIWLGSTNSDAQVVAIVSDVA